jgi:hypothetical protein
MTRDANYRDVAVGRALAIARRIPKGDSMRNILWMSVLALGACGGASDTTKISSADEVVCATNADCAAYAGASCENAVCVNPGGVIQVVHGQDGGARDGGHLKDGGTSDGGHLKDGGTSDGGHYMDGGSHDGGHHNMDGGTSDGGQAPDLANADGGTCVTNDDCAAYPGATCFDGVCLSPIDGGPAPDLANTDAATCVTTPDCAAYPGTACVSGFCTDGSSPPGTT